MAVIIYTLILRRLVFIWVGTKQQQYLGSQVGPLYTITGIFENQTKVNLPQGQEIEL